VPDKFSKAFSLSRRGRWMVWGVFPGYLQELMMPSSDVLPLQKEDDRLADDQRD